MESKVKFLIHSQQAVFGGAKRRRKPHFPFARSAREREMRTAQDLRPPSFEKIKK
jgi:hypothetical protein